MKNTSKSQKKELVKQILDVSEIQRLITDDINSEKKRFAKVGVRYYEADHDIKGYRMFYYNTDGELVEDKTRSNERISHPFFTELTDQLVSFILSSEENPIQAKKDEKLQDYLDVYFDDDFWSENADLLTGVYTKGFDYLYGYKNENNRLAYQYADGMGVVEVREKDTDKGVRCHIYWYTDRIDKNKKQINRIQLHTDNEIYFYVQSGSNGKIELDHEIFPNPRPNVLLKNKDSGALYGQGLGFTPFFRLDYNRKQISGLKPIKALIDDYDLMECGLSNNLQDFDNPIHIVKGFEGDNLDELQQNIKTKKVVGVGEGGDIDIKTINVPYEARKTKADEDEKNIYRFGMGLNTAGLKDTNATTNLAIQMSYSLLELKANKFIARYKKFLKSLIKPVLDEINAVNNTAYTIDDVEIKFKPQMLVNETENITNEKVKAETQGLLLNNLLSVASYIGDEETLKAICEVLDIDYEELQAKIEKAQKEENNLGDAQKLLDGVVPEDEAEPNEEEPIDDEEGGVE